MAAFCADQQAGFERAPVAQRDRNSVLAALACDRFNAAVAELLADIRRELGPMFRIIDRQMPCIEDPDLDAYLADPDGFRR